MKHLILTLPLAASLASTALAQTYRVNVVLENLAPTNGTFLTPVWVGFHNGTFDTYDGGTLASTLPTPGSDALERLAEDGSTAQLMRDFARLARGRRDATLPGPNGPIAPGQGSAMTFLLNANDVRDRYFSYASMVIPSNDAFIANGNPKAHPIFDSNGKVVASDFFVAGPNAVNDAGTEVNDEVPANTAFFGQMAPNTGVSERNVIVAHPGFLDRGRGGILDATRFSRGDFTIASYPFLRVGLRAAPAVTDTRLYNSLSLGAFEVPPVSSPAAAISGYALIEEGRTLVVVVQAFGLADLTAAHLHLAPTGENGPVVVDLLENATTAPRPEFFVAQIKTGALGGPLSDYPVDELVRRIEAKEVYLNLHTTRVPSGEIRGQLARIQ